jgi:hypothetical protein
MTAGPDGIVFGVLSSLTCSMYRPSFAPTVKHFLVCFYRRSADTFQIRNSGVSTAWFSAADAMSRIHRSSLLPWSTHTFVEFDPVVGQEDSCCVGQ